MRLYGARSRIRTYDIGQAITEMTVRTLPLLYPLSYPGKCMMWLTGLEPALVS